MNGRRSFLAGLALLVLAGCSQSGERCRIDGKVFPDRAPNPSNPCEVCSPARDPDGWTPLEEYAECGVDLVCHRNACTKVCKAGAHRTAPGEQHPLEACRVCVSGPSGSRFEDAADGTECGENGRCFSGYCVDACFIDGVLHDAGSRNPRNPCRQCLTEQSTSSWSIGADGPYLCPDPAAFCLRGTCTPGCFIDGEAVPLGTAHPDEPCLVCPKEGNYGWSALPDRTGCGESLECRAGACVPKRLDLVVTRVGDGDLQAVHASETEWLVGGTGGLWRSEGEGEGENDGEGDWTLDSNEIGSVVSLARKPGPLSAVYALDGSGAMWQGGFGARWQKRREGLDGARAFWSAPDGSRLWIVGDAGSVWSGTSLEDLALAALGADVHLLDVHGDSAGVVWAVGRAGAVWRRSDGGWTVLAPGVSVDLHSVRTVGGTVVAIGAKATVIRSDDGGVTWTVDHPAEAEGAGLLGLAIVGDALVAVGEHGTVLLSTDAGATWRRQASGVFETLVAVSAAGDRIVIAGTHGRVVIGR